MDLEAAAEVLIADVLAPSTRRAYNAAFKKWEEFAEEFGYTAIPASSKGVVCYLAYLGIQQASFGTAQTVVAAKADRHARQVLDPRVLTER